MTDYTISSKLSNKTVYACYRGRFWHWNGSIWKESRIMTHRFELARAADKNLTPQAFLTNGAEFAPLDEYEIDCAMLDALENAKPCKNAPHRTDGRGFFLGCSCFLHLLYLHLWRVQRRMLRKLPQLRPSRAGVQQLPDRRRKAFNSRSLCGC